MPILLQICRYWKLLEILFAFLRIKNSQGLPATEGGEYIIGKWFFGNLLIIKQYVCLISNYSFH